MRMLHGPDRCVFAAAEGEGGVHSDVQKHTPKGCMHMCPGWAHTHTHICMHRRSTRTAKQSTQLGAPWLCAGFPTLCP